MAAPDISLYGTTLSGHTHRVELLLLMLGLPYRFVDAPAAVRQSAEFRRSLNPFGQIPVLKDGDLVLADSNAILVYLAKKYGEGARWLPEDPAGAARVQRWLSIADLACSAYVAHAPEGRISLEPYPEVRAWIARVEALPGFKPMPKSEIPTHAAEVRA